MVLLWPVKQSQIKGSKKLKMPSFSFLPRHPSPRVSVVKLRSSQPDQGLQECHQLDAGTPDTSLVANFSAPVSSGFTSQGHPCYDGSPYLLALTFAIIRNNY